MECIIRDLQKPLDVSEKTPPILSVSIVIEESEKDNKIKINSKDNRESNYRSRYKSSWSRPSWDHLIKTPCSALPRPALRLETPEIR